MIPHTTPRCRYCGKDASTQMVVDATQTLKYQILHFSYMGFQYPVCKECAAYWNANVKELQRIYQDTMVRLYRAMLNAKGIPKDDWAKQPQPEKPK